MVETYSLQVFNFRRRPRLVQSPDREAVQVKLFRPVYPPLPLTARISGDVELVVSVRLDGSLDSVRVSGGPPLLRQAALESAQRSQYECRGCSEAVTSSTLIYSFRLGPTIYCTTAPVAGNSEQEPAQEFPQIIQSQNHVTVLDRPAGTCDLAAVRVKVRSAKCLFLWKCGVR